MSEVQGDTRMEAVGFDATVGLRFEAVTADEVRASLTITPSLQQPYGIVHGGVYCSVVETTASAGGAVWFGERGNVVGVSNHTNFLRAVREGELSVRAFPVQRGRTQQLWQVDVRDEQERLVATGQVRLANITDPSAQLPPAPA